MELAGGQAMQRHAQYTLTIVGLDLRNATRESVSRFLEILIRLSFNILVADGHVMTSGRTQQESVPMYTMNF